MKLRLIKTGRVKRVAARDLAEEYLKRLRPFATLEVLELKEGAKPPEGFLVLLDERGTQMTSQELSGRLLGWSEDPGIKSVSFWVGGPYGFSDAVRKGAQVQWALSAATLPSDLAWILVCEQIYRAFTIQKGMPYHHE